jgi:ribonuclease HI
LFGDYLFTLGLVECKKQSDQWGKMNSTDEVVHSVMSMTGWEKIVKGRKPRNAVVVQMQERWTPPPEGFLKINCDGAFLPELKVGARGFVIRDHTSDSIAAGAGKLYRAFQAMHAETLGCLEALKAACDLGIGNIVLETDYLNLVNALKSISFDLCVERWLFKELRHLMFSDFISCSVKHCNRICNTGAHSLAHFAKLVMLWTAPLPTIVNDALVRNMSAGPDV